MQTLSANNQVFPARITRVANPIFGAVKSSDATHTATVPLNNVIQRNTVVQDNEGVTYRVISAREILGKLRLEMMLR